MDDFIKRIEPVGFIGQGGRPVLPLTERVIVKKQEGGALVVTHPDEPQLEPFLEAGTWQLYAEGMLLAEWQNTAQDGGDLASPHPVRHG